VPSDAPPIDPHDTPPGGAGDESGGSDHSPDETPKAGSGLSPVFFVGGLVATAALGGVTVWSGIDTKNNPGPDAVRQACRGQGEACPEYQDGRARQLRTNVLLGATIGVGVLTTAVGIFFTNWRGHDKPAASSSGASVIASPLAFERGGGVAAAGRF
jgi:hypothetical protein